MPVIVYINPELNARRYYDVWVEHDLFGECILVRSWGRIGCYGSQKTERFLNSARTNEKAKRIIASKSKRGYVAE